MNIDVARTARIWNEAMSRQDGEAMVSHLADAWNAGRRGEYDHTVPGAIQDATMERAFTSDGDPHPAWLAVASNTLAAMMRDLLAQHKEATCAGSSQGAP